MSISPRGGEYGRDYVPSMMTAVHLWTSIPKETPLSVGLVMKVAMFSSFIQKFEKVDFREALTI